MSAPFDQDDEPTAMFVPSWEDDDHEDEPGARAVVIDDPEPAIHDEDAPEPGGEPEPEPEPEPGPAGHGRIRLRTAADAAPAEAAPPAEPSEGPAAAAPASAPAPNGKVATLEAEAKAAAQAAYEAYNVGHGRQPAPNAGELLAKAAQLAAELEAAKRG